MRHIIRVCAGSSSTRSDNFESTRSVLMGKPNFNFQKRQREIAKQKKNEEKRQRKLEKTTAKPEEGQVQPQPTAEEETK